jgi:hypothetical protein
MTSHLTGRCTALRPRESVFNPYGFRGYSLRYVKVHVYVLHPLYTAAQLR